MRLKRYVAPTMSQALKIIKSELGPDAVILSTRKIKGKDGNPSLEITAAIDSMPESSQQPSQSSRYASSYDDVLNKALGTSKRKPSLQSLADILSLHGLLPDACAKLERAVGALQETGFGEADALEMVLQKLIPFENSGHVLQPNKPLMLVGPTGAGKTTTLAKLAIKQRLAGHSVGLITLDTYKIGGIEQLGIYADALEQDMHVAKTVEEFQKALAATQDCDYVLIDSAGVNPFEKSRLGDLEQRLAGQDIAVCMVLPANLNTAEMTTLPKAFGRLSPKHLIISKLDETAHIGGLVNAAMESNLGVCFATDGQRVPQDIVELDAQSLARRLVTPPKLPWDETGT